MVFLEEQNITAYSFLSSSFRCLLERIKFLPWVQRLHLFKVILRQPNQLVSGRSRDGQTWWK